MPDTGHADIADQPRTLTRIKINNGVVSKLPSSRVKLNMEPTQHVLHHQQGECIVRCYNHLAEQQDT